MNIFDKYTGSICIEVKNKKECYELQEALFNKGYSWGGGGQRKKFPEANGIFIYSDSDYLAFTARDLEEYKDKDHYTILSTREAARELNLNINSYTEISKNYRI